MVRTQPRCGGMDMHGAEWAGSGPRRSSSGRLGSFTVRAGDDAHVSDRDATGTVPIGPPPVSRFAVCS